MNANTYSILNIIHNNIRIKIDVVLSEIRFQIGTIIKKCTIKNTDLNYWALLPTQPSSGQKTSKQKNYKQTGQKAKAQGAGSSR